MSDAYFGQLYLRFWKKKLDALAEKEVEDIIGLYNIYASETPDRVFDLGAGWGRHMIQFYHKGINPYGIEREGVFVETYRKEAPPAIREHLIHADITAWDVPPHLAGTFPLVISLFSSIGWSDDTRVFAAASALLKDGGIFIVDTDNRDAYVIRKPSRTWQKADGAIVLDKHKINWTHSVLTTTREIHTSDGEVFTLKRVMRLYSLHEIVKMAEDHGLVFLGAFSNLHMGAYSPHAGRNVIVLKKSS